MDLADSPLRAVMMGPVHEAAAAFSSAARANCSAREGKQQSSAALSARPIAQHEDRGGIDTIVA